MLGICHYNNGKYTLFNIKTAHKNKSPKNIINSSLKIRHA